jgi:hypothetical protein
MRSLLALYPLLLLTGVIFMAAGFAIPGTMGYILAMLGGGIIGLALFA